MTGQWISRSDLEHSGNSGAAVFGGDPAHYSVGLDQAEIALLREQSIGTLEAVRSRLGQRAIVSTRQQGLFPIGFSADVLSRLDLSAIHASPRGRLRLLNTIKRTKPDTWITTPCAALDFLARLYMEFNVDPFELGLEHIVLTGEIASPGAHKRLADEFEAVVTDIYTDPLFGAALGYREGGALLSTPGSLALADCDVDEIICYEQQLTADGPAEIVLRLPQIAALADKTLRTGQVIAPGQKDNIFHHTRGDLVLARGQWLSLPAFDNAFKLIDGIQAWQLVVERGEGTLDKVTARIGLNRETLVENPMWRARMRETIASVTAIEVHIDTYLLTADDNQPGSCVVDQREHHIGDWLP